MKRFLIAGLVATLFVGSTQAKTTKPKVPVSKPKLSPAREYARRIDIIKQAVDKAKSDLDLAMTLEGMSVYTKDFLWRNIARTGDSPDADPLYIKQVKECDAARFKTNASFMRFNAQVKRFRGISSVPQSCRKADALFVQYSTRMETVLNSRQAYDPKYVKVLAKMSDVTKILEQALAEMSRVTDPAVSKKKYTNG